MGNLHFTATIDAAKFNKTLDGIEKRIKGIQDNSAQGNPFFNVSNLADGYAVIQTLGDIASNIVKVRGEFQQLEITFTSLLKSKAAANDLMQEVIKMAAESPFELTEIADGAKQLLIFGANAKTAVDDMKMLGDIAVGTATPVNELAAAYGSLRQKGEASDEELQKFAGKGIPIYTELAKILNTNTESVKYFADAGKVGFNEMQQAFANMTSQGGMFEGLMEQQSKTLQGSVAQLSNAFSNMFNGIIQDQEGFLIGAVSATTDLVNNYEAVIDVLKVLTIAYGGYKAAIMTTAVVQSLINSAETIGVWLSLTKNIHNAKDAQIWFNLVCKANPYALLASAIVGVIAALVIFNDELTDAEKAQQKLNEISQKTEKELTGEIAKIKILTASIKDETLSREARSKALNDLIAISPQHLSALTLENAATADGVKAINGYIEAKRKQLELKNLEKELDESLQREQDAKNNKNELGFLEKAFYYTLSAHGLPAKTVIAKKTKELNAGIITSEKAIQEEILTKISLHAKEASEAEKASQQKSVAAKKTIEDYNKEIQAKESQREANSADRKTAMKFEREINQLKRQRAALSGEHEIKEPFGSLAYWETIAKNAGEFLRKINPLAPNSAKEIEKAQNKRLEAEFKIADLRLELDKNYADGSIESYERIAQSAAAMLTKISPDDKRVGDLLKIQLEAQQKADSIRKKLAIKTTDDEIEEKKKQYELYNLWLKHAGKEAADEQFKNLKDSGAGFKEYLEKNINTIQGSVDKKTATALDLENLVKYKVAFESINQNIDDYKQKITTAGQAVGSLTEYLRLLKEEQAKLGKNDDGKKGFLAEQIIETEKKRVELLKSFLIENNIGEEKRLGIQKKYSDLRAELDSQYNDKKTTDYNNALSEINSSEKKELDQQKLLQVQKTSTAYKELNKIVDSETKGQLALKKQRLEEYLKELKDKNLQETDEYTKATENLNDTNKNIFNFDVNSAKELFNVLGQVGQELSNAGGKAGDLGKSLMDAVKQAGFVFQVLKDGAKTTEIASSITGLVLNVIGKIINQKKEERRVQLANNAAMNEYNYSLTERIRLESIVKSNGFTKNYEGQIRDTASALAKATFDYVKAISDMQNAEGPAITGKPFFGLWGEEVRIDNLTIRFKDLVNSAGDLNIEFAKSLMNSEALADEERVMLQNAIKATEELAKVREQGKSIIQDLVGQISNDLRNSLVQAFKDGTSAAEAFGKSVSEIMGNVAVKLLFDKIMQPTYDRFLKEIDESLYGKDGDRNILDDIERYQDYGLESAEIAFEGIKGVQKSIIKATGIDPFKGTDSDNTSLSGSIKSVTEETAGVLAGQLNAIRINQATNLEVNRSQLLSLTKIANNSEYLKHLELLKSIDKKLSTSNDLRAGGID